MIKHKKMTYRKKYKPNYWMYTVIIVIFAIIRCVPISCGSANLNDAFNELAVGAIASTIVALLIEIANCSRNNRELQEKERMVFAEYCGAIIDLCLFVARRCEKFSQPMDELTFGEWLEKLADRSNYSPDISPAITMERTYFHIASYVRNIKTTLRMLCQQYCMLVESDIIDTDDFRQHATLQLQICDDICDTLELSQGVHNMVVQDINICLTHLVESARLFFPDAIPQKYSWGGKG